MDEAEASGHAWRELVRQRVTAEQDREALARLIEYDADPFEVELYELVSDPRTLLVDRAQRRRAGEHERMRGVSKPDVSTDAADDSPDDNSPPHTRHQRQPSGTLYLGKRPANRAVATSEKRKVVLDAAGQAKRVRSGGLQLRSRGPDGTHRRSRLSRRLDARAGAPSGAGAGVRGRGAG